MDILVNSETLTQGQVEKFILEFNKREGVPSASGRLLRAAVAAGWVSGRVEDVDAMRPKEVNALAKELDRIFTEATQPDPKP